MRAENADLMADSRSLHLDSSHPTATQMSPPAPTRSLLCTYPPSSICIGHRINTFTYTKLTTHSKQVDMLLILADKFTSSYALSERNRVKRPAGEVESQLEQHLGSLRKEEALLKANGSYLYLYPLYIPARK